MGFSELDEIADEGQQFAILGFRVPGHPADFVVLAVGIVVATLGAAGFVARQEHRHALRQEQGGEQIALLPGPQRQHLGIVGRPFDPAVPAAVVIGAVAVILEVRLVVLAVITDQILEREAVVAGDEIDAGVGPPAA